jgi:nitroimidazol reductase NimA-like FMN-containing flavoprotein (pyridoxamine 5'-phosphate oxidase superfamily)
MNLTSRTELRRVPDRGSHNRDTINQILDAGFLASVGFCVDGQPSVIPTLYGRKDESFISMVQLPVGYLVHWRPAFRRVSR